MNRAALLDASETPAWLRPVRPHRAMAAVLAGAAVVFGLVGIAFPPAVAPLAIVCMIAAAGIVVAASLLRAPRRSGRISLWDMAGALMFVGCAAATLVAAEGMF